ncbi:hypothetical protein RIF29_14387 [Crotalaria pallida]|uniref:Uncharacterized protein n=1 Tax=Crotalaria pallida TaxID=3830 RepID=A0AAN9IA92_CROPI
MLLPSMEINNIFNKAHIKIFSIFCFLLSYGLSSKTNTRNFISNLLSTERFCLCQLNGIFSSQDFKHSFLRTFKAAI